MVCSKCGAELKEGCVYCSRCGQEAQIVSDVNILEDDLLREIMDEDGQQKKDHGDVPGKKTGNQHGSGSRKSSRKEEEKNRKLKQKLIVTIIILAVAVAAVFGLVRYRQNHSETYLMTRAENACSQKDYQEALEYVNRVLALNEENQDALLLKGRVCLDMKEYEEAEAQFLAVLSLDPSSSEAYEGLITLYDTLGQTGKIRDLMDGVTDPGILALFDDYIVPVPEIGVESGSFSEYFTVELTAPEEGLEIYYTLDGTTPDKNAALYEEPVEISQQGTIVLTAVCMDEDGEYSEPVSAKYKVELEKPDTPTVSPDGGQFSMPATVTVNVPDGTTVYYTWDGSEPDAGSAKYTGPIDIPEGNNILSVIAIDKNGMKSSVLKCNYIYYPDNSPSENEG